jgi:hypothetical protein
MSKILFDIVTFLRNAAFTFFLSLLRPKSFFLSAKYDEYKTDGAAFLFTALILYLVYYTSGAYFYETPKKVLDTFAYYSQPGNIIQIAFFTVPLFLYCTLLLNIILKRLKNNRFIDFKYFGQVMFADALILEALLYFSFFLLTRVVAYIPSAFLASALEKYHTFLYVPLFNIFGSRYSEEVIAILLFVTIYLIVFFNSNDFRNYRLVLLLGLTIFSTNIVNFCYRWEYRIFDPEDAPKEVLQRIRAKYYKQLNPLLVIPLNSGSNTTHAANYVYKCKTERDTMSIFCDVVVKNSGDKTVFVDMRNFVDYSEQKDPAFYTYRDFVALKPFIEKKTSSVTVLEPNQIYPVRLFGKVSVTSVQGTKEFEQLLANGIQVSVGYSFYDDAGTIRRQDTTALVSYDRTAIPSDQ